MNNEIVVCYLFTKFDSKKRIINFIKNYNKYKSGINHKLVICFKLIEKKNIELLSKHLKKINYIEFIDENLDNDFDLGSYKRVSKKFHTKILLFLNSHSYPISNFWLRKIYSNFKKNTILGTSASYQSVLSSMKLKKIYKLFGYLLKKRKYKKKFFQFPNPHLRTNGFMLRGIDFYNFIKNKKIHVKLDAWEIESGKNSMTNYFKKRGFDIFIINSEGEKFSMKNWPYSETFNYKFQLKSLISDNHTRKYDKLSKTEKKIAQFKTWGIL